MRPSAALFALLVGCASAPEPEPPPPPERPIDRAKRLEREGDWLGALQAWGTYETADGCGNCHWSKVRIQREGLYRCLTALDRHEEAYVLYLDPWVNERVREYEPTFARHLVRAAERCGRWAELEQIVTAGPCPSWPDIRPYFQLRKLRAAGDAAGLLRHYLENVPIIWCEPAWEPFRKGKHWLAAEAADTLAEFAPTAWEMTRDAARLGGPRGFWALVALARMRHPDAQSLIGNLAWVQGPVDYDWALLLRSIAEEP